MTVRTDIPALPHDAVVLIEPPAGGAGVDRTGWIRGLDPNRSHNTQSMKVLNEEDEQMVGVMKTTGLTLNVLAIPDADDFFDTWADTLNDQREITYRPRGTGSGKPQRVYDCICTGITEGVPADGQKTLNVTFHANSTDNTAQS